MLESFSQCLFHTEFFALHLESPFCTSPNSVLWYLLLKSCQFGGEAERGGVVCCLSLRKGLGVEASPSFSPALLPALNLCPGCILAHPLQKVLTFCSFPPAALDFHQLESVRMLFHRKDRGEGSLLGFVPSQHWLCSPPSLHHHHHHHEDEFARHCPGPAFFSFSTSLFLLFGLHVYVGCVCVCLYKVVVNYPVSVAPGSSLELAHTQPFAAC